MLKVIAFITYLAAVCFAQVVAIDEIIVDQQTPRDQNDSLSQEVEVIRNQSDENHQQEQISFPNQVREVLRNESREDQQQEQPNTLSQIVKALRNQSRENQQEQINFFFQLVGAYLTTENQQNERIDSLFKDVEDLKIRNKEYQKNERMNSLFKIMEDQRTESREKQQNEQMKSLSKEVKDLKHQSKISRILERRMMYLPPHVYIYHLTPQNQSWQESQQICRDWGGALSVFGVKTLGNRKKLIQNLSINDNRFWIGANDTESEGNWTWVNGDRASESELIWDKSGRQPNNHGDDEDCVFVIGNPAFSDVGRAHDELCWKPYRGLCEKMI